ncbi:hypothetical protein EDI_008150, partial [Entamoeba dispar SAW760]
HLFLSNFLDDKFSSLLNFVELLYFYLCQYFSFILNIIILAYILGIVFVLFTNQLLSLYSILYFLLNKVLFLCFLYSTHKPLHSLIFTIHKFIKGVELFIFRLNDVVIPI